MRRNLKYDSHDRRGYKEHSRRKQVQSQRPWGGDMMMFSELKDTLHGQCLENMQCGMDVWRAGRQLPSASQRGCSCFTLDGVRVRGERACSFYAVFLLYLVQTSQHWTVFLPSLAFARVSPKSFSSLGQSSIPSHWEQTDSDFCHWTPYGIGESFLEEMKGDHTPSLTRHPHLERPISRTAQ